MRKHPTEQRATERRPLVFGEGKKSLGLLECSWGERGVVQKKDQVIHPEKEATYRVLNMLKLEGSKGSVDVLALAREMGVEVRVADARYEVKYYQSDESGTPHVLVPPLETPLDLAILLHELGHAKQLKDPTFAALWPYYRLGKESTIANKAAVHRAISELSALFPDKQKQFTEARIHLEACEAKVLAGERRLIELDADTHEIEKKKDAAFQLFIKQAIQRRLLELGKNATQEIESVDDLEKMGFTFGANQEDPREFVFDGGFSEERKEPYPRNKAEGYPSNIVRMLERALYSNIAWNFSETNDYTLALRLQTSDGFIDVRLPGSFSALDDLIQKIKAIDQETAAKTKERAVVSRTRDAAADEWRRVMTEQGIDALFAYPKRVLERDATVRAKRWLRKLEEKTGAKLSRAVHQASVELFQEEEEQTMGKFMQEQGGEWDRQDGGLVRVDSCAASVAEDMSRHEKDGISAEEYLNRALETYGASSHEMLERGQPIGKPRRLPVPRPKA